MLNYTEIPYHGAKENPATFQLWKIYYYETVLIRFMVDLFCMILLNYIKLKAPVICASVWSWI